MPLPRLRPSRAKSNTSKAAEQGQLEPRLERISGSWSSDGDILNLSGWKASGYKETDQDLIVLASITTGHIPSCGCGTPASTLQRWGYTSPSYIHDVPLRCKRTRIYFKQQRYRCACGKTLLQAQPDVDEKRKLTTRLAEYIGREAFNIYGTFSDLADEVGVSEKTVRDIFTERAERLERERMIETPRWLAIDEVHAGKREYCVITDPIGQRVLDILLNNSQQTVGKWLLQLPNREKVEVVTMDMCPSYLGIVRRVLGQTKIVVDRYHVHNLLNTAIKDVLQVIRDCMSPSEQRKYMRDPRLLLKSRYELSDKKAAEAIRGKSLGEKHVVAQWLDDVPDIARAYWLKERLSDILQLTDRSKAEEKLDGWLEEVWDFVKYFRVKYERQYRGKWGEPFGNVVTTISQWRSMILNYIDCKHRFDRKVTNAFAEYANKQIGRAHLLGNGYSHTVLRLKVIYGGLLVRRRPMHPLDQPVAVRRKLRADGSGRKDQTGINPKANVVRLEKVREDRDETKNLLTKPQDDEGWSARFEQLNQSDLSFEQGAWEPPKRGKGRRKEKDKQLGGGKRTRAPRKNNRDQLKMF